MIGLFEYFQLWDIIQDFMRSPNEDSHSWRFESSGVFTTKSAYRAFFHGSINFEPWRQIWKTWAPPKCKVFLWLAVRDRCWTADHLVKQNLPHPNQCPLCDQADETIQHLLTSCVFAREFWFRVLSPLGLQHGVPSLNEQNFAEWWRKASKRTPKDKRKGFNSLVVMCAWLIWKHRNACVFEGASPNMNDLLRAFSDEHHLWCLAGARKLDALGPALATG